MWEGVRAGAAGVWYQSDSPYQAGSRFLLHIMFCSYGYLQEDLDDRYKIVSDSCCAHMQTSKAKQGPRQNAETPGIFTRWIHRPCEAGRTGGKSQLERRVHDAPLVTPTLPSLVKPRLT